MATMYFKLACLTLALAAVAAAAPETRLVGGTPTTIQEFPYIVAITYRYPGPGIIIQRCVGSLISSWHVLTSGFCFTGAVLENMRVRAGSTNSLNGGIEVQVARFVKHEDYEEVPRSGDLAVAFLATPLSITGNVNVLYIPQPGTYIPDGQEIKIVSWGFESEDISSQLESLKTILVDKLPLDVCEDIYKDSETVIIDDPVICASAVGRGMCLGDSGAPAVIGEVLVGVSSYYEECGDDDHPDVFTRIDRYTEWIVNVAVAPRDEGTPVRIAKF